MTLDVAVRGFTQLVTLALAAVAAYDLVRQRTRERLEIFAFFAAFAVGSSFSLEMPTAAFLPATLALTALPYLVLRLADHFHPVPRAALGLALAGMAYSWLLNLWLLVVVYGLEGTVSTQPLPPPVLAALQGLYVVGGFAYASIVFVGTALNTSGVTAWRTRLAATGSLVLASGIGVLVAIFLATRSGTGVPRPPAFAQDLLFACAAVAAVTYFIAFATPPWGRHFWQVSELHRFLGDLAPTAVGEHREGSIAALLRAADRATGGTARFVSPGGTVPPPTEIMVAVPVDAGTKRFGTLEVSYRRPPLFPRDEAAMLRLMADQTAIVLANDELFRERRELEERERRRFQAELDRVEQEMTVARKIQLSFLPRATPSPPGWTIASFYRPARQVGGDLYDFFTLPDGSLAILIGDASGHGMPAALLMATTRSEVRSAAGATSSPGAILARANASLVADMPPSTFVTCMVLAVDPVTGRTRYANAGHDVAYAELRGSARDLRARGMPLGLMPDASYEELETTIEPDETVLLYTDGIVEAHGPDGRSMFSFGRLRDIVARADGDLTQSVMRELDAFTAPGWEQEDDITMVSLRRSGASASAGTR